MKKLPLILIMALLLILSACGTNELEDFKESFNQSARKYDATELKEDEFGEIEEEEGEEWQILFESNEYTIDIMYEKGNITHYLIHVSSNTDTIDKDSKGYRALLTLADSFDLDVEKIEMSLDLGVNQAHQIYDEGDYEVRTNALNITSASVSLTVVEK